MSKCSPGQCCRGQPSMEVGGVGASGQYVQYAFKKVTTRKSQTRRRICIQPVTWKKVRAGTLSPLLSMASSMRKGCPPNLPECSLIFFRHILCHCCKFHYRICPAPMSVTFSKITVHRFSPQSITLWWLLLVEITVSLSMESNLVINAPQMMISRVTLAS